MELIIVQSDKLPKPWTERFAHVNVACSRLRDSGEKSFSKKKWEKRAGAGERRGGASHFSHRHRPLSQVARVLFSLYSFNTSPLYYLRAWSLAQANVNAVMQVNNPCDGFDYSFIETHSYCKRHARLKLSAKFILAYSKF